MVEQRMRTVASSVGNTTENRLFMLTCMMLADEMLELREAQRESQNARRPAQQPAAAAQAGLSQQDEEYLLSAISHLQNRLDHLTAAVGNA